MNNRYSITSLYDKNAKKKADNITRMRSVLPRGLHTTYAVLHTLTRIDTEPSQPIALHIF